MRHTAESGLAKSNKRWCCGIEKSKKRESKPNVKYLWGAAKQRSPSASNGCGSNLYIVVRLTTRENERTGETMGNRQREALTRSRVTKVRTGLLDGRL